MPLNNGESWSYVGSPIHLSETPLQAHSAPPQLGEHTMEILHDWLHYDAEQIEQLKDEDVIG